MSRSNTVHILMAAAVAAVAFTAPVTGTTIVYTDRATWQAAVTGISTYDMGTQAPGTSTTWNNSQPNGLVVPGLQIQGYTTYSVLYMQRVAGNATLTPYYNWNTGAVLRSDNLSAFNAPYFRITFPLGSVNAFGVDIGAGGNGGAVSTLKVTPAGMPTYTPATGLFPTLGFFGIVTTSTTFNFVDIAPTVIGEYAVIDNISFASYVSAPPPTDPPPSGSDTLELSTLLYLATGLFAMSIYRKRRLAAGATL
jgi:hypothetical protein